MCNRSLGQYPPTNLPAVDGSPDVSWLDLCPQGKQDPHERLRPRLSNHVGRLGLPFVSATFRRTFMNWPFSAGIISVSSFFTLACTILGIISLKNFDKGLKTFRKRSPIFLKWGAEPLVLVNAKERLAGDDFTPVAQDSEQNPVVQFPSAAPFEDVFNLSQDGQSTCEGLPTFP